MQNYSFDHTDSTQISEKQLQVPFLRNVKYTTLYNKTALKSVLFYSPKKYFETKLTTRQCFDNFFVLLHNLEKYLL